MKNKSGTIRMARDFLCGVLIGAGAILPGVSGGVLAVIFDIYRPFMEVLTNPVRGIPRYWKWIPALVIGWGVGFLGFAKGISAALDTAPAATVWLFVGLIAGTLPALYREAGKEGRPRSAYISMAVTFFALFAGLFYIRSIAAVTVAPNFWWYSFCGGLWGASVVVPGLTSSSVLMALGLYKPLMDGLSALNLPVLLSTLPGMLVTIALLARLMSWVFRRHYAIAFHGIFGIVVASTLVIAPTSYRGVWEIVASVVCCAGGALLAWLMGKLEKAEKND